MTIVAAAAAAGLAAALLVPGGSEGVPRWWPALLLPALVAVPGPLLAATCVVVAAAGGALALLRHRRRRVESDRRAREVREYCDLLAADLAAGVAPAVALRRLSQTWADIRRVVEADRFGLDVGLAWRSVAADSGLPSLEMVALAWSYAQQTGVGLAVAMRHVAESLGAQARLDRVVNAELSSARATAWLVAVLPLGVLAMGSGLGGNPWQFLFLTTPGVALLTIGLVLILVGLWWLEGIIESAR